MKKLRIYTIRGWFVSGELDSKEKMLISAVFSLAIDEACVFTTYDAAYRFYSKMKHLDAVVLAQVSL